MGVPATLPASLEDCLWIMFHALSECRDAHFEQAKRVLVVALANAGELPEESRAEFRTAFLYSTLLVQSRQAPETVTAEVRSKASTLLDKCKASESSGLLGCLQGVGQRGVRGRARCRGPRCGGPYYDAESG
jgi:hypothetical protein